MSLIIQKVPFLLELFINGTFILLYSLKSVEKIPKSWNLDTIDTALAIGTYVVPIILFFAVIVNYINSKTIDDFLRKHIFSLIVFFPLFITWGDLEFAFWLASAHLLSTILSLYDEEETPDYKEKGDNGFLEIGTKIFNKLKSKPAQLVLVSFTLVIMIGTFLLMLPVSAAEGKTISFIDALFTSTSATCVTGLGVRSLTSEFSVFGQVIVLLLIQIGGLSIMTLYSVMIIFMGKNIGMQDRLMMQDLLDVSSLEDLFAMIVNILKYTFFIELWGAIVLTIAFTFEGFDFSRALYYGFFHSISAFCNAGFSLFDTSLETYATSPLITGTIAVLVTLGGLGFIVLRELREVITTKKSLVRIGLHSKIVLITSALLTIAGAVFIFFGEYLHALDSFTLWEKIQVSLFQSVTLRTAGFNSIPLTGLHTYTLYMMTLFMFIGGSPGSTAGGVKTTTLAILIQSILTTMRGKDSVTVLDRTIPGPLVVRATALTFISILITSFFILVLMRLETDQNFLTIFFEVISASGTVGLSLGITPFLSVMGKFAVSALMLTGRIGPLTLILAIGQQNKKTGKFDYPDGRIMIG